MARRISAYHQAHPGRPVTLVGYSGGGPMAVWTAEALPKGERLAGIILLSTPLEPRYDLTAALETSRKGMVSFYSNRNLLYLGFGTLVFGTMDRHHEISAGNLGFTVPESSAKGAMPTRVCTRYPGSRRWTSWATAART